MKKTLALILCVLMFASIATTAFADDVWTVKDEKDFIKACINEDTAYLKGQVKSINDAAEAAKLDVGDQVKEWKAAVQAVAEQDKANIEAALNLQGILYVDGAYLDFVYGTEIPLAKAIKGYGAWLLDDESANSFAKTVNDQAAAFGKLLDGYQAGVDAETEAIAAAIDVYNASWQGWFDTAAADLAAVFG